jgi:acetolactate decarboxylase
MKKKKTVPDLSKTSVGAFTTGACKEKTFFCFRGLMTIFLAMGFWGCAAVQRDRNVSFSHRDVLFQTSTINALLAGVYDGETDFNTLRKNGDFGLGTFNGLDGEMIALDGQFYQIKVDGAAYPVAESMKTPFSVVTFFESDDHGQLNGRLNYEQLKQCIDSLIPTENLFYAVKIEGTFDYIKTRSVPKQRKPYPPLVEVVKHQAIFEFQNVRGTILGFRTPGYVKGINVPGYHLHFITEDKTAGGHLLACQTQHVELQLDYSSEFYMVLPQASDFGEANLTKERHEELNKVEK